MNIKISILTLLAISSLHATTLSQAVRQGLDYDPELSSETQNYKVKLKSISLAKSGYLPKVDLYSGIGYEDSQRDKTHSQQNNGRYTRREASAHLRQPIFEGYATTYDISSARSESDATKYALNALAQNKSLKIIKAYLDVLKMQEVLRLAKENLSKHYKIMKSIKERYDQGVTDKADFIQIQGRVRSAQSNLFSSENNLNDAKAVYLSLVGVMPSNLQRVNASDVRVPKSLATAIRQSIERHPTGQSARKNVELEKNRRKGAKSNYYPHFYADLSANHEVDAAGIEGSQDTYQGMIRAEWNVFDGLKDKKRIEIARLQVLRAGDKVNDVERQLELETRLSWNAYQSLKYELTPLSEHVKYANEATKLYKEQYNVNKRSLIDVLNSQVEYFNAKKAYISAKYDEIAAKYRVLNSMGVLHKRLKIAQYVKLK